MLPAQPCTSLCFQPFSKAFRTLFYFYYRGLTRIWKPLSRISEYLLHSGSFAAWVLIVWIVFCWGDPREEEKDRNKKISLIFMDVAGLACSSTSNLKGGTKTWNVLALCERILSLNSVLSQIAILLDYLAAQNYSVRDFVFSDAPALL